MFKKNRWSIKTITFWSGAIMLGLCILASCSVAPANGNKANPTSIQQAAKNGMTISVNQVTTSQDKTDITACMDVPSKADWMPEAVLQDSVSTVSLQGFSLINAKDPATTAGNHRCYHFVFSAGINPSTRFVIQNIHTSIPESLTQDDCAQALVKIRKKYPDFSFTCTIGGHGIAFNLQKLPDGISNDQGTKIIKDTLIENVQGPWELPLSNTLAEPTATVSQESKTPTVTPNATQGPQTVNATDSQALAVVTHNGISVTLTWAYADSVRIGLEYRISGLDTPEGFQLYCPVSMVTMKDDTGHVYDKYVWLSQSPETENLTFHCQKVGNDFIVTQNYYGVPSNIKKSVGLTFDIYLGGFDLYSKDGTKTVRLPDTGPLEFNYSVPITGSLTLDPGQTTSKNGVTVKLNRLAINPTFTNVYLCISYDNNKGWYPDLNLTWDGLTIKPGDSTTFRTDVYQQTFPTYLSQFTSERCFRYSFFFPYQTAEINHTTRKIVVSMNSMTINAMDAATQNDCLEALKAVQQKYPELDFNCDINNSDPSAYGFIIRIIKAPAGMNESLAQKIAEDAFKKVVAGPWQFTVDVP
jgi:hypothetical protein